MVIIHSICVFTAQIWGKQLQQSSSAFRLNRTIDFLSWRNHYLTYNRLDSLVRQYSAIQIKVCDTKRKIIVRFS